MPPPKYGEMGHCTGFWTDGIIRSGEVHDPGMAFQHILSDGSHSYEIVVPASVPDRVRAGHVFDAVANEVRQRYVCARAASIGDDEETETSGRG